VELVLTVCLSLDRGTWASCYRWPSRLGQEHGLVASKAKQGFAGRGGGQGQNRSRPSYWGNTSSAPHLMEFRNQHVEPARKFP
jgi:hypothetical protein